MNALVDRRSTAGIILVALGLMFLATQWFDFTGAAVLGLISVFFLAIYATRRQYGFLVPGMILGGLAVGVAVQEYGYDPNGGIVVLGLGAGFVAIYLIDVLVGTAARWWPLIPGGILSIVGATQLAEGTAAADTIARLWPLGLIAAGVIVLIATFLRPRPSGGQTEQTS
ncbi:MAG: hypothetical protein AABM32_03155 [Chloroflexota bacterium]